MKLKNSPLLEAWLKKLVRNSRDSVRNLQASALPESRIFVPDFLGIGAPRAASTWLHTRLSSHPEVYLPHRKELHFFDQLDSQGKFKYDPGSIRDRRLYATFFQGGKKLTKGEITPAYSCLPQERVEDIVRLMPGVKIIYILRNPVERAWSGIRRRCWYGEGKKADEVSRDKLIEISKEESLLIRGDYRRNINVWEMALHPANIHYMFYDDISENGVAELEKLCRFLGVTTGFFSAQDRGDKVVNEAPVSRIPEEVFDHLMNYYRPDKAFLEQKFSRDLSAWYR